jgi:hypothetical protein
MTNKPHLFQPGGVRPEGAGMKPGQKTKKVKAREESGELRKEALSGLFSKVEGKTTEEIMAMMNYNPLVHAISIAMDPTTPVAIAQKANAEIMKKTYPDLKSVETKGEQVTAIRVIMPGMAHFDDKGMVTEGEIIAGQLEQKVALSDLTGGLSSEDDYAFDQEPVAVEDDVDHTVEVSLRRNRLRYT